MNMPTLHVHTVLPDRILVSRESAHLLDGAIKQMLSETGDQDTAGDVAASAITVDFEGVEGIAPSFLDELLSIIEGLVTERVDGRDGRLIVANPPTRLSSKFQAVARGHAMSIRALPEGSWLVESTKEMQR